MRVLCLLLCLLVACGTDNVAEPYTDDTPDEKAKRALDEGRYDEAIAVYEDLIAAEPDTYRRYPLLAAAYAGKAGVDIVSILKTQLGGSSSSGNSVFDVVGSYVPADPTADQLTAIQEAVAFLVKMPEEHRTGTTYEYAGGAAFQLSLFLAASSAMVLNQFKAPEGGFTPESLANMTDADVEAVLSNLDAIIATRATGQDQDALQEKAQKTLDAINEQPGATSRERLTQYLGSKSLIR